MFTKTAVFASLGIFVFPFLVLADDEELRARFAEEAPVAWAAHEEFCRHVQGIFTETFEIPGKAPDVRRYAFGVSGDLLKVKRSGSQVPIRVINADYLFGLQEKKNGAPYTIVTLGATKSLSPDVAEEVHFQIDQLRGNIGIPYSLVSKPLSERVKDPNFHILDISHAKSGNKQFVRVDFEYKPPDPKDAYKTGSYVVLDPDNFWCIQEYFVIHGRPQTGLAKMEYGEALEGFPVLKRKVVEHEVEEDHSNFEMRYIVEFESFERAEIPASEFTLTAYGLPEPDLEALRAGIGVFCPIGTRTTLFLFNLALVFAVLVFAILGWLLLRKRRRSSPS